MKIALLICSIVVGSTLIANVDSTLPLLGAPLAAPLLLGGHVLRSRVIPRLHLFENFMKSIHTYFGERLEGFHSLVDGFGIGIQGILNGVFGDDCGKFLGPLSQIPEGVDLEPLLGDKLKSKADVFAMLIPLAKKYCETGQCEKLPIDHLQGKPIAGGLGGEFQKSIEQFFSSFEPQTVSRLDTFHSNVDDLIKSLLANGKHGEEKKVAPTL
ncbi:uncharacterized protein LOC123678449 isoform X2 [Harmonia axyridis]|uniref:uncharacterized protein LOC123678449 isoform X2 n=1 Tax=Harmonia axyridis TaxID=115357 RepID=UPI001E2769E2|nr:uncharacterized protein LOC123678449 isoform X2 [Harmonia axyridis]